MNESQIAELHGYCQVAYFALSKPMRGESEISSTDGDKLYHFVSEEARQEFDKNPERYVPAFGGLCAFGMSIEKEFEADPTNFRIIDGRLHLFLRNNDTDALQLWNKEDESKCLANANQYWAARLVR